MQENKSTCFEILGVPLNAVQIPSLIQRVESWIQRAEEPRCLIFANVHVVMESQKDEYFCRILHDDRVVSVPDGKPLIVLGRGAGHDLPQRVAGPQFMYSFITETASRGYRHFFYGGKPGVAEQLSQKLLAKSPSAQIAGLYSPPFRSLTPAEDEAVVKMIRDARPDVVWVGLGCPKQEKWAYEHAARLGVPVVACVGQAFDIHAGVIQQAPKWMRECGLEWLYRLGQDPRRLWRRYLIYNSLFLWQIARRGGRG